VTQAEVTRPAEGGKVPVAGGKVLARNSAVAGGAVVVNGVLSAAVLAWCAAHGQTGEIAAYTVMTSALAFVVIVAGGGSALLYINGDEDQRTLVRSQWMLVLVPAIVVGAAVVGGFYWWRGYAAGALGAGGVIVLGNALAQLQASDFSRRMRFVASAVLMCGSKAVSLLLVLVGVPLTGALAVVGLVQLVVGEVMLGEHGSLRRIRARQLSMRDAIAAYKSNRHLFGYAVGELYVARVATVVLSLVATPTVMGSFGTVVTAYQAIGGVVQSALQVPMVARARSRLGIEYTNHSTVFSVGVALICALPAAIGVGVLAPWLTGSLLALPQRQAARWLGLFMVALPFMAVTRALMLTRIGDGEYRWATRAMGLLALLLTGAVAVGVPVFGPLGAAGATAAAEITALGLILAAGALVRRFGAAPRRDPGTDRAPRRWRAP
jgi:O-antigen/teichoic acid export membrane protein